MIRLIEALNFRCLRYIRQPLGPFHILVGPNASGKTTFLDVIAFLGKLVSEGLDIAISERTNNFSDLVWRHEAKYIELSIEAVIPEIQRKRLWNPENDTIRYEVRIGITSDTSEVGVLEERVIVKRGGEKRRPPQLLFPMEPDPPSSILNPRAKKGERTIVGRSQGKRNVNFNSEVEQETGKGWVWSLHLKPQKSALANLPEDESKFPVSTWFKDLLIRQVQSLVLNSLAIRRASPPGQGYGFKPDGSNLPWVIDELRQKAPDRYQRWIDHLRTALPDIVDIQTIERLDDKHRYIKIIYPNRFDIPSWMASDGTLRLLNLTLLAYLPQLNGVYLIEEPENGIHPRAIETVYQSLSSMYDAQTLLATHSPVILGCTELDKVLCFKKTQQGVTDIVTGTEHPDLKDWKGKPNLSVMFGSGVLG